MTYQSKPLPSGSDGIIAPVAVIVPRSIITR